MYKRQEVLRLDLLMERMRLDLVHRRHNLVMNDEIHDPIRWEVADADGADHAFLNQLLHCPPRAVDIAIRLVNEVEIEICLLYTSRCV